MKALAVAVALVVVAVAGFADDEPETTQVDRDLATCNLLPTIGERVPCWNTALQDRGGHR